MARPSAADTYVRGILSKSPNMLIPHYLMHSYLYYQRDSAVISDELYDEICNRLLSCLPSLKHPHKHLVDEGALRAGTGFHLSYPSLVMAGAEAMVETIRKWQDEKPTTKRKGRKATT